MNGASHGIITHVCLVNNCGLYLKERRKWCMYCTQVEAYGIVTHMFLQVFYVDYFKKLDLTLAESKLDKYKDMLTQCHKLINEVVDKLCAYGIDGRQIVGSLMSHKYSSMLCLCGPQHVKEREIVTAISL